MTQIDTITPNLESAPEPEDFVAFVARHFDPVFYRQAYPDMANSKAEPLQHWLSCGLTEGRQISRYVDLRHGGAARRSSNRIWRHFRWRGKDVAARVIDPLPSDVIRQIADQARHDPAIHAAGVETVAQLSQQDRENVHLDVQVLRRALPRRPDVLLIVPELGTSRAQSLAGNLVRVLGDGGQRSVQTLVADRGSDCSPDAFTGLEPWRSTGVVFWPDFRIHGPESVNTAQLAQLISVLQPRVTIVAHSRRGNEIVARYGRALSTRTKLYCVCTAADESSEADPDFGSQALAFATILTDDAALADRLQRQSADRPIGGVVTLPHHSTADFRAAVISLFGQP